MREYDYIAHTFLTDEELRDFYSFYVLTENLLKKKEITDKDKKERMLKVAEKVAKFFDDSKSDSDEIFELTLKNYRNFSPEMKQIQ